MEGRFVTKGKVVLVPFPFDDLSSSKVRPAVCLTEPIGPYRHIVVAFITSARPAVLLDTDLLLEPGVPGYEATGLLVPSTLRLHRQMTVAASFIRRELGALSPSLEREVAVRLRMLFALE